MRYHIIRIRGGERKGKGEEKSIRKERAEKETSLVTMVGGEK